MNIGKTRINGRDGWKIDNGTVSLGMLAGGGHIAALEHKDKPGVNPLWQPIWPAKEPWQYKPKDNKTYAIQLLGAIAGHNVCLGWFGDPSPEEAAAGMQCHGEAPVAKWRQVSAKKTAGSAELVCECDLPETGMELVRTVSTRKGSTCFHVTENIKSLHRRDTPFTMCEHVTFGPPFLQKGVTVFDMPATRGHTFRGEFSDRQRLRQNSAFVWPKAPGAQGEAVDLRMIEEKHKSSSDFTTQLMDMRRKDSWFTAVNPELGLMVAYVWNRKDFQWVGNWEENYGRRAAPWKGKTLARGMEFANSPFPVGLRNAVDLGFFHGERTFRWLPALGCVEYSFDIVIAPVDEAVKGVLDIRRSGEEYVFDFIK